MPDGSAIPASPPNAAIPDAVAWHNGRCRAILREHAEVRELFGSDPTTGSWTLALVVAQVAIALAGAHRPFWVSLILSGTIGYVTSWANLMAVSASTADSASGSTPARRPIFSRSTPRLRPSSDERSGGLGLGLGAR